MDSGILMIEDMNARKLLVALTSPESKREDTVLIFHRYNDRYFLNKVVSSDLGVELKTSADEQALIESRDTQMKTVSLKLK